MIKLCVFDLDGTLINSLNDLADATNYALKKSGFSPYPVEKYRYFVGDGVPMLIKRALGDSYSPEMESALLSDFNRYYNEHYADHTAPYEGIKELLSELSKRGILSAVLSNKPDNFVKIIISEIFSDFKFSWIQGKMDGFPKKPDPTALNFIMKSLNVNTDETLYIGDSNIDIFTGKNANVKTCGVLWGFRTKEELEEAGADYIVDSPLAVLDLID
ncbi:hypothetical protein CCDG5_0345 [[Clostridium] cellulosi]|uniref:Phosphoglycolate phosphatase n=1 Tax=[Clostridium] cellulosi TaxID=29343 RepID=A0A078KLX6_9FIRM|nr:hypothetical protein CCDG5_0345 [[Clostridium] cellulosi]